MSLSIKPAASCGFDQISLGEVMLRLDPGEGRIRTAREFRAWEGGGEYNTSRGLRKCFRLKTAVCTAFVDNEVGHLVEDFIMQGGVATDFIRWREDDGIGRTVRNGLNFTERGFGIRGAVGVPILANITEFGSTPLFTIEELALVDVDIALYPLSAFRAMNKAAERTYRALRTEGSQKSVVESMQTRKELYDSIGYWDFEHKLDELFAKSK